MGGRTTTHPTQAHARVDVWTCGRVDVWEGLGALSVHRAQDGKLPVVCELPDPKTAANWASEAKPDVLEGAVETGALPAQRDDGGGQLSETGVSVRTANKPCYSPPGRLTTRALIHQQQSSRPIKHQTHTHTEQSRLFD